TAPDPTWTSLLTAPNHPEYPSAHATLTNSLMQAWVGFFGTDQIPVTVTVGAQSRTYTNVEDPAAEAGESRILGGIHYRSSIDAGSKLGRGVGHHMWTHYFKAIDDDSLDLEPVH